MVHVETTPGIQWHQSVAGNSYFTYVGDYKIVRFGYEPDIGYYVQKCDHGMPVGKGENFDYLDDALSWIGER